MMIIKVSFFKVVCDKCGAETITYKSRLEAVEEAFFNGWHGEYLGDDFGGKSNWIITCHECLVANDE